MKTQNYFALLLLLLFAIISCNDTQVNKDATIAADYFTTPYNEMEVQETVILSHSLSPDDIAKPETSKKEKQQIIKTAHLDFETDTLVKTHGKIMALVTQYEGSVQNDNSGKDYRRLYHKMIVRVPSQHFDAMLASISDGVSYFDRREISQRDVTEEFVDITARLKAKRVLENRYLQLLKQAKNVKEMLEIERQLAFIREEIESRQGRLQYLKNQVSMSTVYLNFYKTTVETGVTTSYGAKMKQSLQSGWQGISSFFLGLLTIWPLLIIIILCILFVRNYIKKRRKKKK